MIDESTLRNSLSDLPLGGLRFFERTTSTNDNALAWAAADAPDLALVCAEEQTSGRGRASRTWFTPPGAALAFSLIFKPLRGEQQSIALFSALGALAVCEALALHGLLPEIKWPNDVLLNRRKVCGILAESVFLGDKVDSIVMGVGLNIKSQAVPPTAQLNFPATSLERELPPTRRSLPDDERVELLKQILQAALYWRSLVATEIFLHAWERRLAFRGEQVEILVDGQPSKSGRVSGLENDGSLRLLSPQGERFSIQFGEVRLRPVV